MFAYMLSQGCIIGKPFSQLKSARRHPSFGFFVQICDFVCDLTPPPPTQDRLHKIRPSFFVQMLDRSQQIAQYGVLMLHSTERERHLSI